MAPATHKRNSAAHREWLTNHEKPEDGKLMASKEA
jgi:hypothetical protein